MSGVLWDDFRQGNRSEYLAQYFLSALGVCTPVPRQEDIGIDFYCALAEDNNGRLTFHSPFTVQAGSKGSKDFHYGGIKDNRWRGEEVHWLFSQDLPLLLCLVDKAAHRFELFSTSAMWTPFYHFGNVAEVTLLPGKSGNLLKGRTVHKDLLEAGAGDGSKIKIPLGPPVISLEFTDLTNRDLLQKARASLKFALELDARNIRYRRLHVHYSTWLLHEKIEPNELPDGVIGINYAWNLQEGRNTPELLKSLAPIVIALAFNFDAQKREDKLKMLKGILSLLPKEDVPRHIDDLDRILTKLGL